MANLQNHKRVKIWKEDMITQQFLGPKIFDTFIVSAINRDDR